MRPWLIAALLFSAAQVSISRAQAAGTPRFGLDTSDPARSGSCIGRAVNTAMCGQRLDLNLVPQLATSRERPAAQVTPRLRAGAILQDGTPFDAEAVRASIGHDRTASHGAHAAGLKPPAGADAVDTLTVL